MTNEGYKTVHLGFEVCLFIKKISVKYVFKSFNLVEALILTINCYIKVKYFTNLIEVHRYKPPLKQPWSILLL